MKYKVKYTDNTGNNDSIVEFNTEEEAEKYIEDGLNLCKEFNKDYEYDYGDFGNTTEFWVCDDVEYATWERMWL